MKISYYPGCTLKSKAKNLDLAARASLEKLGVELVELERWNCCGAVASLAADDLIHLVGPVRNLVRAKEQGADQLLTLCSMCYNTLARANEIMRHDEEKRKTINMFMDEEIDYFGEVEVVHYLSFLQNEVGWEKVKASVVKPLSECTVANYYGCTLHRPTEVGIEPLGSFALMAELVSAIGGKNVVFDAAASCCGSYQLLEAEGGSLTATSKVLQSAQKAGANLLATSCPLCEYNLGHQQSQLAEESPDSEFPVLYFTQLLALALGVDEKLLHLEQNQGAAQRLLHDKNYVSA